MFLLPASQQSCWSSSRKLKHKERKSLIKIIPGEHLGYLAIFTCQAKIAKYHVLAKFVAKRERRMMPTTIQEAKAKHK